jgi:hypothetical protein
MKNPATYCHRCLNIIDEPLRSCYICLVCAEWQECPDIELYALLKTILNRVESPIYQNFEINFPTVSTQNDIIRRMQRILADIATDIHLVLDRKKP